MPVIIIEEEEEEGVEHIINYRKKFNDL